LSNHASGTAIDINATQWALGSDPHVYLTDAEIAKIRAKLLEYRGCIRWGGDYVGRLDPMHFEIDKDQATCDRVWADIKAAKEFTVTPEDEKKIEAIVDRSWTSCSSSPARTTWPTAGGTASSTACTTCSRVGRLTSA
jgi:hypothetical protein